MKLDFDSKNNITAFDKVIMRFKKANNRINDLLVVRGIVKNWQDVFLFRVGLKKPGFVMQLCNGKRVEINKPEDYFQFWETKEAQEKLLKHKGYDDLIKINKTEILFKSKYGIINFYHDTDKQLANTIGMITGQFIEEEYGWLNVKNKNVIDIGANIGDTAIYFALKGAKHVYAFEPYPYSYNIANKNIKLNKLQDKITLVNQGCGGRETAIKIGSTYKNFGGTDLKHFKGGKDINITTLKGIIKRFNIVGPSILKIDCEGCEYGVLLKAEDQDLRKFEQIQIEYHYGYLNLKRKLNKAGFKFSITSPANLSNPQAENSNMLIGLLYAERL